MADNHPYARPRPRDLSRARRIIAEPGLHSDLEVLEACQKLIAFGDWIDVSRATQLKTAVIAETPAALRPLCESAAELSNVRHAAAIIIASLCGGLVALFFLEFIIGRL